MKAQMPGNMQNMLRQAQKLQKDITIKPEAIDPDMLQDLIIMAVNDAMQQIAQQTQKNLGQYTSGL